MTRPVLYSFRRCPYAMRARLALASAGVEVELREVVLRDKAPEFLEASASATVPTLVYDALNIDESLDIMIWALEGNDPEGWLDMPEAGHDLIAEADGPFKTALDRYKYSSRYQDVDGTAERATGMAFISRLGASLAGNDFLFGDRPTLADMAILPFVRQFAHVDLAWFQENAPESVVSWLERFKSSHQFLSIMAKYPRWQAGDAVTVFP